MGLPQAGLTEPNGSSVPPVHHDASHCAFLSRNALLFVAARMVGKLGQHDFAAYVLSFKIRIGTGPDIDQITGDARRRGLDAVPKRVGNHGLPCRGQKSQLAPLGETHQSG